MSRYGPRVRGKHDGWHDYARRIYKFVHAQEEYDRGYKEGVLERAQEEAKHFAAQAEVDKRRYDLICALTEGALYSAEEERLARLRVLIKKVRLV